MATGVDLFERKELIVSDYVERLHARAAEWIKIADEMDTTSPFVRKGRTFPTTSIWHPVNKAKALREEAAVLLSWTEEDEAGYLAYVADGPGGTRLDTSPLSREVWKTVHEDDED